MSAPGPVNRLLVVFDMNNSGLNDEQLASVSALGHVRAVSGNTILVAEGDESIQLFVVLSGRLRVYLADTDGKEITLDTLGPADMFGELALLGEARSASVVSLTDTRLSVIRATELKALLMQRPDICYAMMLNGIRRGRQLTRAVGSLALLDVYGRIARLLLEDATCNNGKRVLSYKMTHQDMARRVNCSREMVSRILADLREGGYIELCDGHIVLRRQLPERW